MRELSQQPYFLRALYEWCVDSGHTPYLTVRVDARTRVPKAFVKDSQIVLNIGPSAVRNLHMDGEWVTFSARFGGMAHTIEVPVANVLAIYAKETGQGMGFSDMETEAGLAFEPPEASKADVELPLESADETDVPPQPPKGRPRLRIIK
jgi:stringent starvation protein B